MKSAHASKPPMHASSQSLKDSKTSEPSRCSSIAVTSLSGLSGNSMLQLRRHQELSPNQALQPTPYSVRSVRRASGREECGNTLGVQAPNEPLERSIIDHSRR